MPGPKTKKGKRKHYVKKEKMKKDTDGFPKNEESITNDTFEADDKKETKFSSEVDELINGIWSLSTEDTGESSKLS